MKKLVVLSFMMILSSSVFGQIIRDEVISVMITQDWTVKQLDSVKAALEKKKIIFKYSDLEFTENGKLKAIAIDVNCKDGFRGGGGDKDLSKVKAVGFIRDYRINAKHQFRAGVFM